MNELTTLEMSLRELLAKLDFQTCPLILGGGFGLYLRRIILQREGERTLLDRWPEARATNDLDLFLRPELMCDSSRLKTLKSALDELGYEPVKGAEHYQFRKEDWEQSNKMATANAETAIFLEASRIVQEMFHTMTSQGLLVMRANPYCTDDLKLDKFIELTNELFIDTD